MPDAVADELAYEQLGGPVKLLAQLPVEPVKSMTRPGDRTGRRRELPEQRPGADLTRELSARSLERRAADRARVDRGMARRAVEAEPTAGTREVRHWTCSSPQAVRQSVRLRVTRGPAPPLGNGPRHAFRRAADPSTNERGRLQPQTSAICAARREKFRSAVMLVDGPATGWRLSTQTKPFIGASGASLGSGERSEGPRGVAPVAGSFACAAERSPPIGLPVVVRGPGLSHPAVHCRRALAEMFYLEPRGDGSADG